LQHKFNPLLNFSQCPGTLTDTRTHSDMGQPTDQVTASQNNNNLEIYCCCRLQSWLLGRLCIW